jgi:TetR/AcrR family transcriptional repressor of nem operon
MGRPPAFDTDDALAAAMEVFWKEGYAGAHYDALVEACGASRKGLYSAFGDKGELYLLALRRYRRTVAEAILEPLRNPEISKEDIAAHFRALAADIAKTGAGRGCLLANSAFLPEDAVPGVGREVDDHLKAQARTIEDALGRAGLPGDRAHKLGIYLSGVLQGLFLLAHTGTGQAMIETVAEEAAARIT